MHVSNLLIILTHYEATQPQNIHIYFVIYMLFTILEVVKGNISLYGPTKTVNIFFSFEEKKV